jgi:hypothetical protein
MRLTTSAMSQPLPMPLAAATVDVARTHSAATAIVSAPLRPTVAANAAQAASNAFNAPDVSNDPSLQQQQQQQSDSAAASSVFDMSFRPMALDLLDNDTLPIGTPSWVPLEAAPPVLALYAVRLHQADTLPPPPQPLMPNLKVRVA